MIDQILDPTVWLVAGCLCCLKWLDPFAGANRRIWHQLRALMEIIDGHEVGMHTKKKQLSWGTSKNFFLLTADKIPYSHSSIVGARGQFLIRRTKTGYTKTWRVFNCNWIPLKLFYNREGKLIENVDFVDKRSLIGVEKYGSFEKLTVSPDKYFDLVYAYCD